MRSVLLIVCLVVSAGYCKKFKRCELAKALKSYGVADTDLATLVCIAGQESSFDTSKHSKTNRNGSRDNGLFQINDKYWCTNVGNGHDCKLNCAKLRDEDISDDVTCAKMIIKKQGFSAWSTYKNCKSPQSVNDCF